MSRNLTLEPGKFGLDAGRHGPIWAGLFLPRKMEITVFSSGLLWGLGGLRHIKCLVAYSKCSLNTSFVMAQGPHPLVDDSMLCLGSGKPLSSFLHYIFTECWKEPVPWSFVRKQYHVFPWVT